MYEEKLKHYKKKKMMKKKELAEAYEEGKDKVGKVIKNILE